MIKLIPFPKGVSPISSAVGLIIDCIALVKQGDNRIGSVCPSLCPSVCARSPNLVPRDMRDSAAAKSNKSHYQSKEFLPVCL